MKKFEHLTTAELRQQIRAAEKFSKAIPVTPNSALLRVLRHTMIPMYRELDRRAAIEKAHKEALIWNEAYWWFTEK